MTTSRIRRAAALLLVGAIVATPAVIRGSGAAAEPTAGEPRPVKAVVLVDQSGSLRPEGVAAEREAAAIITQAEFSPDSELAVVGFASENGRGQSPVDVVCPMTKVDSDPHREVFTTCVQQLRIREPDEGDDTDFVSAVKQSLSMLGNDPADTRPKIIFLLTDGVLDVSESARYGTIKANRNKVAQQRLKTELARARAEEVQIWPLGFGPEVDEQSLAEFAASGGQDRCNDAAPTPRARVVGNAADVVPSLLEAFASARCAALSPDRPEPLPSGETKDFTVDIPGIATDGSITVVKRDPRVVVEYLDPRGRPVPKRGVLDATTFQVSGEQSSVEVLRMSDPEPGQWTIRLRSSPGLPHVQVSTRVLWQGIVQAAVLVDPPRPRPGEPVTVSVAITTNRGTVDPRSLASLGVGVKLTGEGITHAVDAVLRDDGRNGDAVAGDGQFTGRLDVPSTATGALTFVGSVSGEGIVTDERPANTQVLQDGLRLQAQIAFPSGQRVAPGGRVAGTVRFTNDSGEPARVRLVLTDPDSGTLVTATPAQMEVPPGSGVIEREFVVDIAAESQRGPAQFVLRVVDEDEPTVVYGNVVIVLDVNGPPPPWWQRLAWLWLTLVGATALAAAVTLVVRWRARSAFLDVRSLVALLYHGDQQINYLSAPDRKTGEFRFVIRDGGGEARLDRPSPGESPFVLRRQMDGNFSVRVPIGAVLSVGRGERIDVPGGDLQLGIRDERPTTYRRAPEQPDLDEDIGHKAMAGDGVRPHASTRPADRSGDDDSLLW